MWRDVAANAENLTAKKTRGERGMFRAGDASRGMRE
jgi:hypothetical protein